MDDLEKAQAELELLEKTLKTLREFDVDLVTSARGKGGRKKKDSKPDWVKDWEARNTSNSAVKHIVKTTEVVDEATKVVLGRKTELIEPVVLPAELALGVLHEDRKPVINWSERPTHDVVAPRGLSARAAQLYEQVNAGNPLELRDEGPAKPVRKQMLMLNKVWKYRNFKKCLNCEAYDTWESRTDPYNEALGVRQTHAEIWCHTCGAIETEVSNSSPAHIGSWSPPRETEKERRSKEERRGYRWARATYSLVQSPKTVGELVKWFREVELYEAVDMPMLDIQLRQMQQKQLVVLEKSTGKWWDKSDYDFERSKRETK